MDNGLVIAVKRLNSVSMNEPEFKRHMDMVGNIRHENVVPLRAYYCSTGEKLVMYDYHSKGSMYALLHGQSGENLAHVDWETRLRIALGAAKGISKIHSQNAQEFRQHMEVIGRMRHQHVNELKAYYFSKDEVLLFYDYLDQESVSTLLYGKFGAAKAPLDVEMRLKIAIGAARGIAYIHEQNGGKLVHGDIKSSKIFLDEQRYGIISDAGIGKVTGPVKRSSIRSSGYWAPEVTNTEKVSQASDVFSFGVILLELVSRRPSQHTNDDGEVVSLVKWFQSFTRDEWTTEVIDGELKRYQNDEERMMQLLGMAMHCVAIPSKRRPRMFQVVRMLEEISGIKVEPYIESGTEYKGRGQSIESILEDLLPKLIV